MLRGRIKELPRVTQVSDLWAEGTTEDWGIVRSPQIQMSSVPSTDQATSPAYMLSTPQMYVDGALMNKVQLNEKVL